MSLMYQPAVSSILQYKPYILAYTLNEPVWACGVSENWLHAVCFLVLSVTWAIAFSPK